VGVEFTGLLQGFAAEELGGYAGYGNGGLTAETLEAGPVDHLLTVFFGKFEPHPHHVAAFGAPHGAHSIGIAHFPQILGLGDRLLKKLFVHVGNQNREPGVCKYLLQAAAVSSIY
jgi:hypothetical protein